MLNKRIEWIDTVRGLSIFLVVLGHTILPHSWLIYIFSFHMPLFFFLSGYLSKADKNTNLWEIFKKKTGSLLWPYVFFFGINLVYWILFFESKAYFEPIKQMLYSADKLSAPFIPLWFLTTLFVTEIIFYILRRNLRALWLPISILFLCLAGFWLARHNIVALPWGIDIALVAILFYYAGYLTQRYKDKIKQMNFIPTIYWTIIFLVTNFLLAKYQNTQVTMIYRYYGYNSEWLFILAAFSGIFGYILLGKILKNTILKRNTVIEFLGRNSLIILGLHTVFYYYVTDFFRLFLHIEPKTSVLYSFIYTIITLALLTPFIYLINKSQILALKTKSHSQ
jgi:acyltransferase